MDARELSLDSTAQAANQMSDELGLDHPTAVAADLVKRIYRQHLAEQISGEEKRGRTKIPRVYIDIGQLRRLWIDAAVGLGFVVGTGAQSGIDTLVAAFAKALTAFKLLSEDEEEVVHNILYLSKGHAYSTPVAEALIRTTYTDATVSIDDILNSLAKKGVIRRTDDSLILVY